MLLNLPILRDVYNDALEALEVRYQQEGDFLLGGVSYVRMRDEVPQMLAEMLHASQRIKRIVEELKDFARPDVVAAREPFELNAVVQAVMRAVRIHELERENRAMSDRLLFGGLRHPAAFSEIVTADRALHAIFAYVEAVASSPQPLLITGDSGVGKELIARAVHRLSGVKGPLVLREAALAMVEPDLEPVPD